jgi:hypothetical protein
MSVKRATLLISGLSREDGAPLILAGALARVPGVMQVRTNPSTKSAHVDYDPDVVDLSALVTTVRAVGLVAEVAA